MKKVKYASNETEKVVRKRRIDFYKKNGIRITNISYTLFTMNFAIMCLCNIELENSFLYEELKNIYKEMILSKFYSKYVKISYIV